MSSIPESDEDVLVEIEEQAGVSYDPDSEIVEFSSHQKDTEQFVSVVEYLVREGYITKDALPITPPQAYTRDLINATGEHSHKEFVRPREVGDGVYVETNHDSPTKGRYAGLLIRKFVLDD